MTSMDTAISRRRNGAAKADSGRSTGNVTRRIFDFAGLRVSVSGSEPRALAWLTEFLCPNFTVAEDTAADCAIVVTTNPRRYAELHSRNGGGRREIDCFARDTGTIRLPVWKNGAGASVVHDERFKVVFLFGDGGRDIVRAAAPPTPQLRISLMRAVRELAMNYACARGYLMIHGAALSCRGRGIACVGPKSAGKTTFLLAALTTPESAFIANDRIAVHDEFGHLSALGLPTIVAIRRSTLSGHPDFAKGLRDRSFRQSLSLSEVLAADPPPPDRATTDRISISPAQFCHLLGSTRAAATSLSALVFPKVDPTVPRSALTPVVAPLAAERVRAGLLHATQRAGMVTIFSDLVSMLDVQAHTPEMDCDRLVTLVPCYDCVIGTDILNDPARAQDLIEAMLGAAP